jgi:ribosomal protein L40E
MQTKQCHKCGEKNLLQAKTCFNCGAKLSTGAAIMNLIKIGGLLLLFWIIGKYLM